jgi:hypothetical protein
VRPRACTAHGVIDCGDCATRGTIFEEASIHDELGEHSLQAQAAAMREALESILRAYETGDKVPLAIVRAALETDAGAKLLARHRAYRRIVHALRMMWDDASGQFRIDFDTMKELRAAMKLAALKE